MGLVAVAGRILFMEGIGVMSDDLMFEGNGYIKKLEADIEAQARRIAELEAALKPVSELNALYVSPEIARVIRAARAAYLGEKE